MTSGSTNQTDHWGLEDLAPATRQIRCRRLVAFLVGLILLASTSLALAQDEVQVDEEEVVIDAGFEIAESNFDQWIFGAQTSDHGLKRIELLLTLKVDSIDHVCGLTEDQMAKFQLAGQGDIKRFYDDVDAARAKFMKVRRNQNAFNNIWQEIQPLQARVNTGLFGQASFFQKVLKRSLNDEQFAKYEEAERQRWQFRHSARLALVVAMLERTMPLRAKQRERFISVLEEETEPVKVMGQYDYYVALYQLAKVPNQRLMPIFDKAQWKVLQQFKANGLAMEPWLKQQKVLP